MKLQGLAPPGEHQGADGADGDAAVVVWSPLTGLPLVPPPVLPLAPPLGLALDPLTGLAEEPQLGLALEPRLELPPGTSTLGQARELMTWLAKAPPIVPLLIAPPPGRALGPPTRPTLGSLTGPAKGPPLGLLLAPQLGRALGPPTGPARGKLTGLAKGPTLRQPLALPLGRALAPPLGLAQGPLLMAQPIAPPPGPVLMP